MKTEGRTICLLPLHSVRNVTTLLSRWLAKSGWLGPIGTEKLACEICPVSREHWSVIEEFADGS